MKLIREFPIISSILVIIIIFTCSCATDRGIQSNPGHETTDQPLCTPIFILENNALCFPADLKRVGSDGLIEKLSQDRSLIQNKPGSWIYMGKTPAGTVKSIVVHGESTPLSDINFGAEFEIQPKSHPVDINPSQKAKGKSSYFTFSVLSNGEKLKNSVCYSASHLGRVRDKTTGLPLAVYNSKTMMGQGRVLIDSPGIWWITAEKVNDDKSQTLASLTFTISDEPGPDHFSAFLPDGFYLKDMDQIADHLADADVIFVGEKHDDPVAHYLETEILKAMHKKKSKVALSMEMFETDVQHILSGYVKGLYKESRFLQASRPWSNYSTDYRPMVEYAKANGLHVIAANAPRRLVTFVTVNGPDKLSSIDEEELKWLAPIPYHIPIEGRYVDKLKKVFHIPSGGSSSGASKHPGPRTKRDWISKGALDLAKYDETLKSSKKTPGMPPLTKGMPPMSMMMNSKKKGGNPSQSLWDATMAYSIHSFIKKHPDTTVVQVNGSFHSDEHLGTVEQLLRYNKDLKIKVISIVPDDSFPAFDKAAFGKVGDIIIISDPSFPKK